MQEIWKLLRLENDDQKYILNISLFVILKKLKQNVANVKTRKNTR